MSIDGHIIVSTNLNQWTQIRWLLDGLWDQKKKKKRMKTEKEKKTHRFESDLNGFVNTVDYKMANNDA